MKRVVVTGASGFLGSTVCRQLIDSGDAVTAFVRPGSTHPTLDLLPVRRAEGDINDPVALRTALRGCDGAIHTAFVGHYARSAAKRVWQANAVGTRTFIECCLAEGVGRVVVVNSISTFATGSEASPRRPDFRSRVRMPWLYPYLASKLAARDAVERCRDRLNAVVLFCSPMYGRGDKHAHTGRLIRHLATRPVRFAPPGGTSVVAVDDAADACVRAVHRPDVRGDFVLASEHRTFLELYNLILQVLGTSHRIERVLSRWLFAPALLAAAAADLIRRDGWFCPNVVRNGFRFRCFDATATQAALDWAPRVDLTSAITQQVAWMRGHGQLPADAGR